MWVKLCANTTVEDAALAAELGADAVGFVFARSRRQVTVRQVAAITSALTSKVERIGVFDSEDAEQIAAAATHAGLDAVQLHSGYHRPLVERLRDCLDPRIDIIPVLHWTIGDETASTAKQIATTLLRMSTDGMVRRVLIDSKVGVASGGTGVAFDWAAARSIFLQAPAGLKLILAGGLTPQNIGAAVQELHPWGVDVASGVEAEPGRKDVTKIADFLRNARTAD
jgi:phosphoribosylanthranilate isomerase